MTVAARRAIRLIAGFALLAALVAARAAIDSVPASRVVDGLASLLMPEKSPPKPAPQAVSAAEPGGTRPS